MGKSASQEMQVTDYRMSLHYGICHSADELVSISVGEKEAWSGSATTQDSIEIDNRALFGGQQKEGGVVGIAEWLPGAPTQLLPDYLAARLGLTPSTAPGYRGQSSVWFHGGAAGGFLWGTNNPYLRSIWFRLRRTPKGLPDELQRVAHAGVNVSVVGDHVTFNGAGGMGTTLVLAPGVMQFYNGHSIAFDGPKFSLDGVDIISSWDSTDGWTFSVGGVEYTGDTINLNEIFLTVTGYHTVDGNRIAEYTVILPGASNDANPAAIIYECLTNRAWGMGSPESMVNMDSFIAAAEQLRYESFGLSMKWTKQSTIEAFVTEVLDHIQGALFINPRDGKFTLKLIRNDYDPDSLPILSPENCTVTSFDRKAWADVTSEIVVTWTNPLNEQEETVVAQDLASIVIQGGQPVSDSRNYYGVRNAALAMRLAKRDLVAAGAPVAVMEIEVDRSAWDWVPGGCAKLNYPEYDMNGVIVRITKIDNGKIGDPTIKLNVSEDIFSLPQADYVDPINTAWVNPSQKPQPLDYIRIITAPYFFTSRVLSAGDALALEYPSVKAAVLASSGLYDTHSYELFSPTTEPNGDVVAVTHGTKPLLGYTTLTSALAAEVTTVVPAFHTPIMGGAGPRIGGFVLFGNVGEGAQEIALLYGYDDTAGWTLKRGVLDTIPRDWAIGTAVWFVSTDSNFIDTNAVYSANETVNYKLVPFTSLGQLSLSDAEISGAILTGRPHLPNRPANVVVAGVAFGGVDLSSSSPTTVDVSWANRNRTLEDGQVLAWTDATVTPESGQTTTIRILGTDGSVLTEHTGLTGTSFSVPIASFGSAAQADVRVVAVRDGLESLQGHTIRVKLSGTDPVGTPTPVTPPPTDPGGTYEPDPGEHFPPPRPGENYR